MEVNKKILASLLAVFSILSLGVLGAKAFQNGSFDRSELAQKIAERFNLNKDEVQGVMDQLREEKRMQREEEQKTRQNEKLDKLVSEGKITEDQKSALIAKWEEMKNNQLKRMNMQSLSDEEREEAMGKQREEREEHRQEMEQWMENNGIDIEILGSEVGMGLNKGLGSPSGGRGEFRKGMNQEQMPVHEGGSGYPPPF